jgi:ABC-type transporter Mla subunit MlaD
MKRMLAMAAAAAILLTGCSEINSTIDKAQACLEAPKILADLGAELTRLKDDPQAMNKALDDSAAKLNDLADKAANTTIKEATDNLATELGQINVTSVNEAVDTAQKVTGETATYLDQLRKACS